MQHNVAKNFYFEIFYCMSKSILFTFVAQQNLLIISELKNLSSAMFPSADEGMKPACP